MRSILKILGAGILSCLTILISAQSVHRGIRANKKKKFTFEYYQFYSDVRHSSDDCIVERFHKTNYDSVTVQKNGSLLTTFLARNTELISAVYKEYYPDGTLKALDSLNVAGYSATKNYFEAFRSKNLTLSKKFYETGALKSILYYSRMGSDSLFKEWYASGILKTVNYFRANSFMHSYHYPESLGEVIETLDYYPSGILSKKESAGNERGSLVGLFNEMGIITSVSFDTVVLEQKIVCKKNFYNTGIIHSITYFQDKIPCHNWQEYTKEGALLRTVKKAPPREILIAPVAEAAPPELFIYVEESAEYRGGENALKNYFNERLTTLLRESQYELEGKYQLIFTIGSDGKVSFEKFQGLNTDALKETLKHQAETMPAWRPAKMMGRAIRVTLIATLKVSDL